MFQESTTIKGMSTVEENNGEEQNTYSINDRFLFKKPFSDNDHSSVRSTVMIEKSNSDKFIDVKRHLTKRTIAEDYKEPLLESEGESRASIPFLPSTSAKEETQSSGSGLPSVPGLPQLPGVPDMSGASSNTPTAVFGGFSLVIMPMPGLTMSNIGTALQTGQQITQVMPGLSSLAG